MVFKISNYGNELSKVAESLDLYQKEAYFYENLANLISGCVFIPQNFGVIRAEKRLGIILEDLRKGPAGEFNIDLNQDVQTLLAVVGSVFKMHDTYYFPEEKDLIRSMKNLVKPNTIEYFNEII